MSEEEPLLPDVTELTELGRTDVSEPERIGNYRLLQKLGEGGMGIVYEAEQERPVRRTVALKIIKLGMDTEQVVIRFESERQVLALMNHPCIARVYDAGATAEGRPFFAMECVRGVSITEYCDRRKLDTSSRLELLIRVCAGVQHAHQKGIIHRDIKPSNVLVRDEDGKHVPKIIDFGIAKATAQRVTERTFFTEMGQLVGTPEYMSPEQAEMSGIDIDTRADVYQLGVLLYELLTGELPHGAGQLRKVGFNEFRRRILEEEPLRPSARVSTLDPEGKRSAIPRGRALARSLRGELDWITMKALEKDRTRRYSAASELAADIERYLKNEPVLAGPPSNVYRAHKFVRRHRAGVAFAAILFVLLTSFATTMTIQRNQVARARDRAKQEAQTNQRVSEFLSGLFMQSDPSESRGHEMTAREILDRGATRIREELKDAPALQARLMSIMGDVYSTHGRSDRARELLDHALQIQQELNDDDLAVALTMERLAGLYSEYGNRDRALRYYKKVVEIRLEQLGEEDPAVAQAMNSLANVHRLSGNREVALELYEKAANIWSSLDPNNPQLAATLSNRAIMLQLSGDHDAARPLLERALAIRQRAFGPDHPDISWSLQTLGTLLEAAGDYAGARRYLLQALEMNERLFEPDNRKIGLSLVLLATLCARQGELPEAEAFHARAASLYEETDSYESAAVLYLEASYALAIGDPPAALELLRKALVEQDFLGPEALKQDPNFVPLHGDPGFDAIVAAISGASASSQLPGDQSRE